MKRIYWFVMIAAILLSACAPKSVMQPAVQMEAPAAAPMEAAGMGGGGSGETANSPAVDGAYSPQQPAQERLVVRNADLTIVVPEPQEKMDAIAQMADQMGGFVVTSNIYQASTDNDAWVPEATISIRVPAEKLEEALTKIKENTIDVQKENRTGQDVTKEYVDLKSRLRTYEDAEEQLRTILEEKTNPKDVLDVFNQMMYYREQIELIKGQIAYFEEAARLSAINITIIAEEKVKPIEIGPWKLQGELNDAVSALVKFLRGFVVVVLWLIILIIPAALLILVLLWGLWKLFRFFWRLLFPRKQAVPASPPAPASFPIDEKK